MTVKKGKEIVVKNGTKGGQIVIKKKEEVITKKIIPIRRELTEAERKVYNDKLKRGVSAEHPSMPGNEKIFTSKQLFIIPEREVPKEEELKGLDKEIKHHIKAMSKENYKKYPIEIIKGIRDSLIMSRNTIASLKTKK